MIPEGWGVTYGLLMAFLAATLWLSRPAWLAFRKRRSGYGTVFHSETGIPEALATVSLRDVHGRVVRTAVTDKQGRYRLMAPKGEYFVEVSKPGFSFPSKYLSKKTYSSVYDRILPSPHVMIKDYGVMTKNIPIDPVAGKGRTSVLRRQYQLPKGLQYLVALSGPVVAVVAAWQLRSWPALLIGVGYLVFFANRFFSFKPAQPPFGTIRDAQTGEPVDQVVVRLFELKQNKLLETQITSEKGRYAFLVKAGTYRILFERAGYRGLMLNFPNIAKDPYLLARDVKMRPV